MNNFTEVPFSITNLDRYYIRSSILKAVIESLPLLKGKLLDIGCGQMPYRDLIKEKSKITEYVGVDIENALVYDEKIKPDYTWNGEILPFENNEFDTIFMTEVLEHVPNPGRALNEAYRVLQNEGILFFTVPFFWPLHETPRDEYRYTPFSLKRIFEESGFTDIQIYATGGWHASLAQMLGLWVRRSNLSNTKKYFISHLFKPIMKILISKDKKPTIFGEGQLITGLYGSAQKKSY
jgi:SAM-dependent methyltransferase